MGQVVICPSCQAKSAIPDDAQVARIRCARCGTVYEIGGEAAAGPAAPPPVAAPSLSGSAHRQMPPPAGGPRLPSVPASSSPANYRVVLFALMAVSSLVVACLVLGVIGLKEPEKPATTSPATPPEAEPPIEAEPEDHPRPHIPTEVDRILESLTLGNIAYNTPSSMRCGEKTKIQLLLSPRAAIEELKQKIRGLGEKVGEQIRVADVMEAHLYGEAFETRDLRPARQAVGGADDTEWQWEIVAKEPGIQELHLVISAVLNVNGREGSKVLKVYDRIININITISQITRIFITNNWHWLIVAVVAIGTLVLTWSVGWRRSRGDGRFPNVIAPEVLVGKIKVLLFAANPRETDPLDLHREYREIDEEIRIGEFRDALELIIVPGTRLIDLLRKLNEVHPDIVHFSGHGNIDEEIILESGEGNPTAPDNTKSPARDMRRLEPVHEARRSCSPTPLSKSALVDIVKACNQENIRVVVLNACHTRPQAKALSEVVDCVISMNREISDVGAIKFAASFYGALAFGRSVKNAFDQGVARLKAEGLSETETPELVVRAGVEASTLVLAGPMA